MSIYHDRKRHNPEVHEWCYRMLNDPAEWEKFRCLDAIHNYNSIIDELQKMYEQTPATNRYIRHRIESEMKEAKRDLEKTIAEYDKFKEYKERTAISK